MLILWSLLVFVAFLSCLQDKPLFDSIGFRTLLRGVLGVRVCV
jgi:hypothetical protein